MTEHAAFATIGLSVLSLVICLVSVPRLLMKVGDVNGRLVEDMDEFRTLENDIVAEYRYQVR
jgi:hypothetical protein